MAAKKGIVSPMEASLSRPVDDSAPEGFNTNHMGHVFNMPLRSRMLKHLTEPAWPKGLDREGDFGGPERAGGVVGRKYELTDPDAVVSEDGELEYSNRPSRKRGR